MNAAHASPRRWPRGLPELRDSAERSEAETVANVPQGSQHAKEQRGAEWPCLPPEQQGDQAEAERPKLPSEREPRRVQKCSGVVKTLGEAPKEYKVE